ncbi:MAG TPA: ABC transporter permease [Candidatus Limnocylindrales bacterium]|nr:ABC transporter permease [Candidatus Limnocylindrales bacterium]
MRPFLVRLASLFRRRALDRQLEEELRFHLEMEVETQRRRGMNAHDADLAARREFGGVAQTAETYRDRRGVPMLELLIRDFLYGVRTLRRSPGFTAIAVISLALGIGANTAIFSMVSGALMRALPVADAPSLVLLTWTSHHSPKHLSWSSYGDCQNEESPATVGCAFSQPMFNDVRTRTSVFSGMAAFARGDGADLSGNGDATRIDSPAYVSGDFFQTLGIHPFAGRLISSADDAVTASPVCVLSYNYWRSNFGGSPSAIGKTISLNKSPFTIIGIVEPKFDALSPGNTAEIWLPLADARRVELPWDNRDVDFNDWWLVVLGRLKPGVSRLQAQAAVSTLFHNEVLNNPRVPMLTPEDNPAVTLLPAQDGLTGYTTDLSKLLYVLMLAVGVVLLIACANVAGLLLSRAAARHKEIALRFALGARRGRIVRQLLTESLLLSVAGGLLGLLFARWATTAMISFVSANVDGAVFTPVLDLRVLTFTAAVSILTGVLFGLAPALRGMRIDLTPALKEGSGAAPQAHRSGRWFTTANALVVAQVGLTVVVLAAAGLLVRTLQNLKSVDPGFDTRNILTFRVDPTLSDYKRAEVDTFYRDLQTRLSAIPGVLNVTYSFRPLLAGGLWSTSFSLQGHPPDQLFDADMMTVGSGFFDTMRIPLRLGRQFTSQDFDQAARVAETLAQEDERIAAGLKSPGSSVLDQNKAAAADLSPTPAVVNEAFVKQYFPNQNPLGLRFGSHPATPDDPRVNPGWEIEGVVGNARYNSLRRDPHPTIYTPSSGRAASFEMRTALDPASFVPQVRSIVGQMDRNLPVFRILTESQQIDRRLFAERFIARLSSFFGLLALTLACIGLYGLLSYEVSRRTREIGIRMALGARAADVLRLVIGQGIALAAVGALVGIAIALGITRFLSSLLYNVKAADPLTFAAVALLLAAVAALACYIPARRATRVDPLIALRYE